MPIFSCRRTPWVLEGAFVSVRGFAGSLPRLVPLLFVALGAGCAEVRDELELSIQFQLDPEPPSVGPTSLLLDVCTDDGRIVEDAEVHVEATMSHAGMVPEFITCTETQPGKYAGSFEFTMGGDWILIVDVDVADGRSGQSVLEVSGVDPLRSE